MVQDLTFSADGPASTLGSAGFFFFVLIFFVLLLCFFLNHIFPFGLFFFPEIFAINAFLVIVVFIGLFFHCACILYRDIKQLES